MRPRLSAGKLVAIVCAGELLVMAPFSMFLALQPMLRDAWHLSNTDTGWISSAYYAGYMVAVPVLASLTDRYDARAVWLGACGLTATAAAGFGARSSGVWSAVLFQALAGAGLAGTYMPGLKVMADRMTSLPHPRHVAFYTTTFTIGSSVSFYLVEQLAQLMDWRYAIATTACGPVLAWIVTFALLPAVPVHPSGVAHDARARWSAVFASGRTLRYVAGYMAHMWELFAFRSWLVPFLTFCARVRGGGPGAGAATLAAGIALFGVPSSLAGAESSARTARKRVIISVMAASALASLAFGLSPSWSWPLILAIAAAYSALISADSAALTAGLVAVSPAAHRGTAMALYSMAGFACASAGSFAIGAALDLLGGQSLRSWAMAGALMGLSNVIGVAALAREREAAA